MRQSDLFKLLGAPLVNSRWSWGAVRKSDGAVFLRVWRDRTRDHNGVRLVQITHNEEQPEEQTNLGHRERLEHFACIRDGAQCYLIMCEAADVNEMPRKVKAFDTANVYPGGALIQFDDNWWIEVRPGIPIENAMDQVAIEARIRERSDAREAMSTSILTDASGNIVFQGEHVPK